MRQFFYRTVVSAIILAVTIAVSVIWEKMVYTIPVLAVLLFLAAGLRGLSRDTTRRHLDQEAIEVDTGPDVGLDSGS